MSKMIQAELLEGLADHIKENILDELRNSPFFSLLLDESTDVAVEKQLIIYGRYLDSTQTVGYL